MSDVPFNINHFVRVRLTPLGRQLHRENHDKLVRDSGYSFAYRKPEEDADGWSRWELWALMREFGPHIHLGCAITFETGIILECP